MAATKKGLSTSDRVKPEEDRICPPRYNSRSSTEDYIDALCNVERYSPVGIPMESTIDSERTSPV